MMSSRWARFTRGWLIAAFSVFTATLSHSYAGGITPGWLSIVLSLAFASIFSMSLARTSVASRSSARSASQLWRTGVSIAGSQLVFHGLFTVLGAAPTAVISQGAAASSAHAGHLMSSSQIASQLAAAAPLSMASDAHHDVWMLLGHALAGALTLLAVVRGEHAARGLARTARIALRALAVRPISIIVIPDAAPIRVAQSTVWVPRPLDIVHASLRHRGPPAYALA